MNNRVAYLFCFLIIGLGVFARFYNLSWGAPYFFHPDERNIASAVSQLSIPNQLNPHFFAYGSLPLYSIYLVGLVYSSLFSNSLTSMSVVSFETAIITSRLFSAFFSVATVYLLFLIGKKIANRTTGLILALLAAVSPGLIQYAHFGTFEMWITFLSTLLLFLCILLLKKSSYRITFFSGVVAAALVATKVSSLVLIPTPLIALFLYERTKRKQNFLALAGIFFITLSSVFIITSPYIFLDYQTFKNSISYESAVALGTLPVFYTQSFIHTTPVIFQFTHIYPFILSVPATLLFILSIPIFTYNILKRKSVPYALILLFFLILLLSQAILYTKWIRYIIPTLPFALLIIVLSIQKLASDLEKNKKIFLAKTVYALLIIAFVSSFFYSLSYIFYAHIQKDTRVAALEFAKENIATNSSIVSETYDLGIVPFNAFFPAITLVNFYDEGTVFSLIDKQKISNADYIILPSQRVLKTRLTNPTTYPQGHAFYSSLSRKEGKFSQLYQTPCPLSCQILYNFGIIEETAFIFDRPTVYIFKRND